MDDPESPFEIDPARLDRELIRQPRLSAAAGRREAEARHAHAQAKVRLEVAEARLKEAEARAAIAVRAAPATFGLRDKPTVDEVAAAACVHPMVVQARAVVEQRAGEAADALYEVEVAKAAVTAYLDRRKSIEGLISLMELDYWAEMEPRTSASVKSVDEIRRSGRRDVSGGG